MNMASQDQTLALDQERQWLEKARLGLCQAAYTGLKQVRCQLSGSRLVLTGAVRSYYQKQMAQSVVFKAVGSDLAVENRLNVIN